MVISGRIVLHRQSTNMYHCCTYYISLLLFILSLCCYTGSIPTCITVVPITYHYCCSYYHCVVIQQKNQEAFQRVPSKHRNDPKRPTDADGESCDTVSGCHGYYVDAHTHVWYQSLCFP